MCLLQSTPAWHQYNAWHISKDVRGILAKTCPRLHTATCSPVVTWTSTTCQTSGRILTSCCHLLCKGNSTKQTSQHRARGKWRGCSLGAATRHPISATIRMDVFPPINVFFRFFPVEPARACSSGASEARAQLDSTSEAGAQLDSTSEAEAQLDSTCEARAQLDSTRKLCSHA